MSSYTDNGGRAQVLLKYRIKRLSRIKLPSIMPGRELVYVKVTRRAFDFVPRTACAARIETLNEAFQ